MNETTSSGTGWPSLDELRRAGAEAALAHITEGVVEKVWAEVKEGEALLRLESICGPMESDRMQAALAEIERRWALHLDQGRDGSAARPTTRADVANAVYQDIAAGRL